MHPVKIAESFVGTPYCLGGLDRDGMDCFSYIMIYMENNRVKTPDKWEEFSRDKCGEQYKAMFEKDPDKAKEVMVRFMTEVTNEIPTKEAMPGDILLLDLRGSKTRYSLGIMAGNNRFYSVVESQGVVSIGLNAFRVRRAFRWRQH